MRNDKQFRVSSEKQKHSSRKQKQKQKQKQKRVGGRVNVVCMEGASPPRPTAAGPRVRLPGMTSATGSRSGRGAPLSTGGNSSMAPASVGPLHQAESRGGGGAARDQSLVGEFHTHTIYIINAFAKIRIRAIATSRLTRGKINACLLFRYQSVSCFDTSQFLVSIPVSFLFRYQSVSCFDTSQSVRDDVDESPRRRNKRYVVM